MKKRSKVVVVPGRLTPEKVVEKCDEMIEFAKIGGIDKPTVKKLEEAREAALAGRVTRLQKSLLVTVEKAVKTSMRWKFKKLREVAGVEATAPKVQGPGVLVNGVEWKNPVAFRRRFEFRCPRARGNDKAMTMERCAKHDCTCMGLFVAQVRLSEIEEKIEEERGHEKQESCGRRERVEKLG